MSGVAANRRVGRGILRVCKLSRHWHRTCSSDAPVLTTWTAQAPTPILDPLERTSEILFGIIMVLTFTASISVAESGRAETREVLLAALGCNVAWGIVDAAFYLMGSFIGRARRRTLLRAVRESPDE